MPLPNTYDKSHGSPYDRGNSDAYYGRGKHPHRWESDEYFMLGKEKVIACPYREVELTDPKDIEAYNAGYDECTDRKNWF